MGETGTHIGLSLLDPEMLTSPDGKRIEVTLAAVHQLLEGTKQIAERQATTIQSLTERVKVLEEGLRNLIETVAEAAIPSGVWGSGLYNTNEAKLLETVRRARALVEDGK